MLDLGIVIVSYNTRDLLRSCLRSVFASDGDFRFSVCVVDNASSDNSADMVALEYPQVHLITSPTNDGYAYANNLGLKHFGLGEPVLSSEEPAPEMLRYALLLNPDTEVPPTALQDMLTFLDERPSAGAAGPKLVRQDGSLDLACRRTFPSPEVSAYRMLGLSKLFPKSERFGRYNLTCTDPDLVVEVDSVVGAFMMVRAVAIQQAGLLDETFFMYGEDLDWAFRLKQKGWEVWYNADVIVLHIKRAASRHSARARREFYKAMVIFYRKHYADDTAMLINWIILAGIAVIGRLDIWSRRMSAESGSPSALETT